MAVIYYEQYNFEEMQTTLEQAEELNVNFPPLLNLLAYYYASKGKNIEKAHSLIKKAIAQEKHNPHFLDTYAYILYKQKKYHEALDIFTKLVNIIPHDATIQIHLAKTQYKLEKITQAQATLNTAQQTTKTKYEKTALAKLMNKFKKQTFTNPTIKRASK